MRWSQLLAWILGSLDPWIPMFLDPGPGIPGSLGDPGIPGGRRSISISPGPMRSPMGPGASHECAVAPERSSLSQGGVAISVIVKLVAGRIVRNSGR